MEWAKKTFKPESGLIALLKSEQEWTGQLVRMRNAIEHPGEKSGTLHIANVTRHEKLDGFVPPSWHIDEARGSDVAGDMSIFIDNMLTLAEDLLVECIREARAFPAVEFYSLPVHERDPLAPIRITASLNSELLAKLPNR